MNYSHAFHAGNFADVVKHIILTRLVEYLKKKDSAFRVIDTHAGIGRYDLTGEIARRSPEWEEGIGRLLKAPLPHKAQVLVEPYLSVIRELNPGGGVEIYPGSPLLVAANLRKGDSYLGCELRPQEHTALSEALQAWPAARTTCADGYVEVLAR